MPYNPIFMDGRTMDQVKETVFNETHATFGWLSNMSAHPVRCEGKAYKTAEHLFQCLRFEGKPDVVFDNPDESKSFITPAQVQREILEQPSPLMAKGVAKKYRKYFITTKEEDIQIMRKVVRLKLIQNPMFVRNLIYTEGDIIEDSSNRRKGSGLFWGAAKMPDGEWVGDNNLGKIWMELRAELKAVLII